MKPNYAFFAATMLACALATRADGGVKAVCSLPPIAALVEEIGGPEVACRSIVPANADPHSFEPSPKDFAAMDAGSLYFSGGMDFEAVLKERLEARASGVRFVSLGGTGHHGWLSPVTLSEWADAIAAALSDCGADGAGERAAKAKKRFAEILEDGKADLERAGVRAFAAFHPALDAFADAFGIEQIAVEHDGKDPGPRHIAAARARIVQTNARIMFVQNDAERRKAEAFCGGLALEIVELHPTAPGAVETIEKALEALCRKDGSDGTASK